MEASVCSNGLKILCNTFSFIPIPVSLTENTIFPPKKIQWKITAISEKVLCKPTIDFSRQNDFAFFCEFYGIREQVYQDLSET